MSEFVKGMTVKTQETKYGEIIKIGIKKEDFLTNPFNERGYINIDILTSKEGKKYAKINDYKPKSSEQSSEDEDEF